MSNEPPSSDTALEARIVAWVLGEATAFEASELERLCAERPELLVFRRRMRHLHGLLTEAESAEPDVSWKLPAHKREQLDALFDGNPAPAVETRTRRAGVRALFAIAACLALTFVVIRLVQPGTRSVSYSAAPAAAPDLAAEVTALEKAVRDQEDKVEESRKVLARIERIKAPNPFPAGSPEWQEVAREQEIARGLDLQDPKDAERVLRNDQQILGQLRHKLVDRIVEHTSSRPPSAPPDPDAELAALEKAVRDLEDRVEERRKVLATIVRTKGVVYKGQDSFYGRTGEGGENQLAREQGVQRGLDAQDYGDAKREFEADQAVLHRLQMKLIERRSGTAASGPALAANEPAGEVRYNLSAPAAPAQGAAEAARRSRLANKPADESGWSSGSVALAEPAVVPPAESMPQVASSALLGRDESAEMGFYRYSTAPTPSAELADAAPRQETELQLGVLAGSKTNPLQSLLEGEGDRDGAVAFNNPMQSRRVFAEGAKKESIDVLPTSRMESLPEGKSQRSAGLGGGIRKSAIAPPAEQQATSENPISTFSLNISDASFQLAKAALEKGGRPDPASIKPEQFYNAVDYGDPAPAAGEPVAATVEQSAHPVLPGRNLVRISVRTGADGRAAGQPLRLTLLIDQSGSMVRDDRRAALGHALAQLGQLLTPNDRVSVIGFSRTPRLLADGLAGDAAAKNLSGIVHQSASEGGTNLEEAMKLASEISARHHFAGAQNRIVLFTDGAANLGDADPARLAVQVKALRQSGIAFDIAGIGTDELNDPLLADLARNGNGRYHVVSDDRDDTFARQLAGAFRPAAENVKVQVRFNPERVASYQLIGFEKDRLRTEDFQNDAVDAAELAAEESGVALYQVEILPEGKGEIGEVGVRFRDTARGEMVERTWAISHDPAVPAFDRAAPSMQLAGLSMLAAEKLRDGPLADATDFSTLAEITAAVKQYYAASPRAGEMIRVIDSLR